MFSFLSSFGASSNFEKHRLILTTKTYDAPDQTSLKKIVETFRGQDQETRSQIAFATVIKKIHTSDSSQNWIYLLKNLILLDRVVEENCFLQQISDLTLKPIEHYNQKNQSAKALNSQNILKTYWNLIQYKSLLLSQKSVPKNINYTHHGQMTDSKQSRNQNSNKKGQDSQTKSRGSPSEKGETGKKYQFQRSILSVVRSQKQQFLKTLSIQQIYTQSTQLQTLFELIFKMITSIQNDRAKIKKKKSLNIGEPNQFTERTVFRQDFIKEQPLNEKLLPFNFSQSNSEIRENNQKFKAVREEFFNSKVVSYLHLQLLYKLLSTYSNMLICIKIFISHLIRSESNNGWSSVQNSKVNNSSHKNVILESDISNWKKITLNFLNYSQKIMTYVQRHKNIKGFEVINYQQLIPFQNINVIGMLDEYVDHKNTLEEPDIVKVEELGTIIDVNNHIKVERKAQWSYEKALTARKMVFPSRNLKQKNNAFYNWHNGYSSSFPPKQVLTIDLLMQMRQNPHNPATQMPATDEEDQSLYQPFVVNRHSCIYNFRESNISAVSQFDFISLEEMKKKEEEKLQSAVSRKTKNFYYFKSLDGEGEFQNIYSSLSTESGSQWSK